MLNFTSIDRPKHIIDVFIDFALKPSGFILLAGTNGTGKTLAAEIICRDFESRKDPYQENAQPEDYWASGAALITQATLNLKWLEVVKGSGKLHCLLKEFLNYRILVLDDIGTRIPTDSFLDFLYALIDARHRRRSVLGTIITTNLNAIDMAKGFGDAFISRVASDRCFRFDGKDRRFK